MSFWIAACKSNCPREGLGFIPHFWSSLLNHTHVCVCVGVARLMGQIKGKKSRDHPRSANRRKRSAYLTLLLSEWSCLITPARRKSSRSSEKGK